MLILLDCRPLQLPSQNVEKKTVILFCTKILAKEQDIKWLFLVDETCQDGFLPGVPDDRILRRSALPGKAGWKIWLDWQIPSVVKEFRPDLVLMTGSRTASRLSVPQCLWLSEWIEPGEGGKRRSGQRRLAKQLIKSLAKAQAVFTFSEKDKNFLTGLPADKVTHAKILAIPVASEDPFGSLERELPAGEGKQGIKEQYAEGKEYFLVDVAGATDAQRVDLLKAFSLFKKRQLSNMQLVLCGGHSGPGHDFSSRLESYKYRRDVHRVEELPEAERMRLLGAAYGFVFLFPGDSLGIPVMDAWRAGVPVITAAAGYLPEMAGEGVLYARPGDPASLAGQLMSLYKDERLRGDLIEKGKDRAGSFSGERSAAQVWAGIRMAMGRQGDGGIAGIGN